MKSTPPRILSLAPEPRRGVGGIAATTALILSNGYLQQQFKWRNVDLRNVTTPSAFWFRVLNRSYSMVNIKPGRNLLLCKQVNYASEVITKFRPHLIFAPFVQGHTFWLMAEMVKRSQEVGAKVVADYQRGDFDEYFSKIGRRAKRECLEALEGLDAILVKNNRSLKFFQDTVSGPRVVKLFNPVDTSFFAPAQTLESNEERLLSVSFVGLYDAYNKGAYVLLDAVPKILEQVPKIRFVMAGSDFKKLNPELQGRIKEMSQCVTVLGVLSREEIWSLYQNTDIFVFPSYSEAFGIALVEAMSCGAACVGTRISAVSEILDNGKVGLLIDPGDSNQLAQAVIRLCRDSELRSRLGQAARQRAVEKYDMSRYSRALCDIIMTTLDRQERRS